jgi:hypothetical protein
MRIDRAGDLRPVIRVAIIIITLAMRPVDAHLREKPDRNPFRRLIATVGPPRYTLTTILEPTATSRDRMTCWLTAHPLPSLQARAHRMCSILLVAGRVVHAPIAGIAM